MIRFAEPLISFYVTELRSGETEFIFWFSEFSFWIPDIRKPVSVIRLEDSEDRNRFSEHSFREDESRGWKVGEGVIENVLVFSRPLQRAESCVHCRYHHQPNLRMARFDSATFDSGARFDEAVGSQPATKMKKVKLELQLRDEVNLRAFSAGHRDALKDNANFPQPEPSAEEFDAALKEYEDAMDDAREKSDALKTAIRVRNEKRGVLEALLNKRASYVEGVANGMESVISSAGFPARSDATPTNSMPSVKDFRAKMGSSPGRVNLRWNRNIKGKRGFFVEWREDVADAPWGGGKFVTASRCTVTDLTPGKVYVFRVRALGPKELMGAWSEEVVRMSP